METQNESRKAVVHPGSTVASDVRIEEGVNIGPGCVVESGSSIGAGSILTANIYIGKNVKIGTNNRLFPNCSIGTPPQILGLGINADVGGVIIGNGNAIREQVTIHPSMYPGENTIIGNNNLLMVGVHVGHDCHVDDNIVMSNFTQLSGHCKVETGAWLSGMVLVHQFCTVGKWCYAAGLTGINHDIPPFVMVSGHYPSKVRGINKRGLARAGLDQDQQEKMLIVYRRLYRSSRPLLESAKEIAAENGIDENVRAMVDTIIKSSRHRFGRYLELFRE